MPCLNEAETLATCIEQGAAASSSARGVARRGRRRRQRQHRRLAGDRRRRRRPRRPRRRRKGYGSALHRRHRGRPRHATSSWATPTTATTSRDLEPFVERAPRRRRAGDGQPLRRAASRPGAMPPLHRYLGNPVLIVHRPALLPHPDRRLPLRAARLQPRVDPRRSTCTRPAWSSPARWSSRPRLARATTSARCRPRCSPDGRSRPPHLRSWRDGWRHLRFLLLYSPRWLFLVPGLAAHLLGPRRDDRPGRSGPVKVGDVGFDVGTLLYTFAAIVIGFQAVPCGSSPRSTRSRKASCRPIRASTGCSTAEARDGADPGRRPDGGRLPHGDRLLPAVAVPRIRSAGHLDSIRMVVPAVTGLIVGAQVGLTSFFLSILGLGRRNRPSVGSPAPAPQAVEQPVAAEQGVPSV